MTNRPDESASSFTPADTGRRQQQRDVFALPAARLPFRIAGGLVAALCLLVIGLKLASVLRGETLLLDLIKTEYGMLLATIAMALAFGVSAFTGKVPRPVWKLFQRTFSGVD